MAQPSSDLILTQYIIQAMSKKAQSILADPCKQCVFERLSCFHLVADIIFRDAEQIDLNSDGSLQVLEVGQHFWILLFHKFWPFLCTGTSNKLPVPFSPNHLPSIIPQNLKFTLLFCVPQNLSWKWGLTRSSVSHENDHDLVSSGRKWGECERDSCKESHY